MFPNVRLSAPQHAGHVSITEGTVAVVDLRWFFLFWGHTINQTAFLQSADIFMEETLYLLSK